MSTLAVGKLLWTKWDLLICKALLAHSLASVLGVVNGCFGSVRVNNCDTDCPDAKPKMFIHLLFLEKNLVNPCLLLSRCLPRISLALMLVQEHSGVSSLSNEYSE